MVSIYGKKFISFTIIRVTFFWHRICVLLLMKGPVNPLRLLFYNSILQDNEKKKDETIIFFTKAENS
jgi:hypothetical protein